MHYKPAFNINANRYQNNILVVLLVEDNTLTYPRILDLQEKISYLTIFYFKCFFLVHGQSIFRVGLSASYLNSASRFWLRGRKSPK